MTPARAKITRTRPAGQLFRPLLHRRMNAPRANPTPTPRAPEGRVSRYLNETMRRDPRTSRAVRPFARLENMAAKPAPKKSLFNLFARRPRPAPRNEEEMELRPLSIQERIRDPEVIVGRERIHRNTIRQFKEMIFDERFGMNGTIIRMAPQYPDLASILQEPAAYKEFVQTQVKPPWASRLMALMGARPELRAATLLLYLQVVHKNDRPTRHALRESRNAA